MSTLQVETTSRCTLKCPACSRTQFAEKTGRAVPHHDLDIDQLEYFLDCSQGRLVDRLYLCGDYGDSIYYPRLLEFIDRFKPTKNITLVTNGSYRDARFWTELCARLDQQDIIQFSIDGLEDTNHLYRVNSDWASTMVGLDIAAKSAATVHWETNVFSFNYNRLQEIKAFAESRGAIFRARKTGRFGRDDLIPPDHVVNQDDMYRPEYSDPSYHVPIVPDCKSLFRNTVCSQNYFWPCGYIRHPATFYKSKLWKQREQWAIKNKTLDDILTQTLPPWVQDIEQHPQSADVVCKMRCKQNQKPIVWLDL